jgi:hypothetical protein
MKPVIPGMNRPLFGCVITVSLKLATCGTLTRVSKQIQSIALFKVLLNNFSSNLHGNAFEKFLIHDLL